MIFNAQIIAVLAAFSATTYAFDVYSSFYRTDGTQIGSTNFDVANDGCFSVGSPATVSFSQHDSGGTAKGPYCLTAFKVGGCQQVRGKQQFQNVDTYNNKKYNLNAGVAKSASYKWKNNSC